MFWKSSTFSRVGGEVGLVSRDGPCAHIVIALRHNATGTTTTFACTHLKAKGSDEFEAIRAQQISTVLEAVYTVSGQCMEEGSSSRRCVILGDFNAEACVSGEGTLPVAVPTALQWGGGRLSSAYPLPSSQDSIHEDPTLYTTWKSRKGKELRRMIDYILYSTDGGLEVTAILQPPAQDEILESPCKLPDMRYPSDHISIAADIEIVLI